MARLVDTVDTKTGMLKLIAKRGRSRALIEKIECIPRRIILSQEYINGAFPEESTSDDILRKNSYFNLKIKRWNELGDSFHSGVLWSVFGVFWTK